MNCIAGTLILAATMSGLETSAEFTEVWYREVFLGDVRGVAGQYEDVYTQRPPWQGSKDDERRIAALRAGLCFERIGQVDKARLAYDWLLQHGLHGSAIVNIARSRLAKIARARNLSIPGPPEGAARRGEVSLVRDELADQLRNAQDEAEEGEAELAHLEDRLARLTLRVEAARRLRDRLRQRGAAMFVGSRPVAVGPAGGTGAFDTTRLETRLRAELNEGFRSEEILPGVVDWFYRSALRAAAAGDVATAKRNFAQTLALSAGHHSAAQEFVEKLSEWRDSLTDLARRYLLEERLRQLGDLQGRVRDRLARAGQAARRDSGVTLVVQIWRLLDRAPPEVRREAETSHLLQEADRLFLALTLGVAAQGDAGSPGEELRAELRRRREQIDAARELVRKIVEVTTEFVAMGATTDDGAGAGAISIVEEELQRLLTLGRSLLDTGSTKGCAESVRDAEFLVSWFPNLESYRAPILRLKQALDRQK